MMGGFEGMMGDNMMWGWGAYGLGGGLTTVLLLIGLLGFAAWVSFRVLADNRRQRSVSYAHWASPAEEVLRERYARGTHDDY